MEVKARYFWDIETQKVVSLESSHPYVPLRIRQDHSEGFDTPRDAIDAEIDYLRKRYIEADKGESGEDERRSCVHRLLTAMAAMAAINRPKPKKYIYFIGFAVRECVYGAMRWGCAEVVSETLVTTKEEVIRLAESITLKEHEMNAVPLSCSLLRIEE